MFCKSIKHFSIVFLVVVMSFSFTKNEAFADDSTYQQEFIFLTQQLKSLKKRRVKTLNQLRLMKQGLEAETFKLEKKVASLRGETQILETKLRVFDQERLDQDLVVSTLKSIEGQMVQMSNQKSGKSFESFDQANQYLFSHLDKGTRVHSNPGKAIDLNGKTIEGELLQLGHVITYFKNNEKSKNGEFNLTSRSKMNDDSLYIYKKSLTPAELQKIEGSLSLVPATFEDGKRVDSKTFTEMVSQKLSEGGLVGYVILILGLIGLVLAILRWTFIKPFENSDSKSLEEVVYQIQQGNTSEAKSILSELKPHPMRDFVDYVLTNLQESKEVYESKVMNKLFISKKRLNRFGPYLLVLAGVAPLLGLLGTVTGMIETFSMITAYGTGDPKVLSGGIKAALVTTQLGLIVAIPCILVGNYLSSKASKVMNQFEQLASSIPKE